jgi:hypothetical protein
MFIAQATGFKLITLFSSSQTMRQNKLDNFYQPSLIFELGRSPTEWRTWSYPTNILSEWKGFAKDKRASLFGHAISDEANINLIGLTPRANVIKLFAAVSDEISQ